MGGLIWWPGSRLGVKKESGRGILGGAAATAMLILATLATTAAITAGKSDFAWGGGLVLTLEMVPLTKMVAVMIPVIALPIMIWAAAAEDRAGLPRLLGLLVAFAGAMELLVLAADLLVVAVAWELLGLFSWALIAHHWQDEEKVSAANYAFNATRLGGVGIWFAAGAVIAVSGDLRFDSLSAVAQSPWASWMAAGILAAAASKSAQLIFAPWLFRAMEGPSSVSALLHSSTMVAAGAWLIIRLHTPLAEIGWFGPAALAIGLVTALAGGLTAILQTDAKRLLAASTSAQYGLMFAAAGAGYAAAGLVHLVTHAACKALLFLAAGTAIHECGTHDLRKMRLGRRLPAVAAAGWIGALALAAIPPLGAAWSKEKIIAATGHVSPWLAVLTIGAGTMSAWYALRFQTLAYGRGKSGGHQTGGAPEAFGLWILAAMSLLFGLVWLKGGDWVSPLLPGRLPKGKSWELVLSIASALTAAVGAWLVYRRPVGVSERAGAPAVVENWWGMPVAIEKLVSGPVLSLAGACAIFDRKVVDAGIHTAAAVALFLSRAVARVFDRRIDRGVDWTAGGWLHLAHDFRSRLEEWIDTVVNRIAALIGFAAEQGRKAQTGAIPTYLAILTGGFFFIWLSLIFGKF
jgi:NADH:ubiquinone oxidoreductase subunit 5 (subunit L)/multisubunit Na+/H+ antiporter MnhA subunit